ncbi:MAG: lipase maturation factor family protein [Verrucomicrobiota bacterium]|nr:lipase maturation factor family protein [Verrucomicrobiota bacterium]
MIDAVTCRVGTPPASRPLVLYDGECTFCCLWIERFRQITGERVDYATAQIEGVRFPEIGSEAFSRAVWLVQPDGHAYSGAEAVYKALAVQSGLAWVNELYECSPLFAKISEVGYGIVARNRMLFSRITRLAWGKHVAAPGYRVAGYLFPRVLGAVALIALLSLWMQVDGLIGSHGILPMGKYFEQISQVMSERSPTATPFASFPAVFWWLGTSDAMLHGVIIAGILASVALIIGLAPPLASLVLWAVYLSLTVAGQIFTSFQWDVLLIECAFVTIFFAPWRLLHRWKAQAEPYRIGRWLLWLVLFLIMFESGIVKIQSYGADGGNTWRMGTALNFHYWTQPIPSWSSWYIDKLPEWFDKFAIGLMLVIELILPFFFFAPRRLRHAAAFGQILLQVLILASGNYGFFNLLMLALCIPLFDDGIWPERLRNYLRLSPVTRSLPEKYGKLRLALTVPVLILFVGVSAIQLAQSCADTRKAKPTADTWLERHPLVARAYYHIAPWRTFNSFGLFRVMTTARPEIELSGSNDATEWAPYNFKYKAGPTNRAPVQIIPGHMPRLDWQLWFAALQYESTGRMPPWVVPFLKCLAANQPEVMQLLAVNPYPDEPPKFIRIELYHYSFSSTATHDSTGNWWQREKDARFTIILRRSQLLK